MSRQKIGIYVDAVNVTMNGGYGLRYDILRKFACRDGEMASRLNVYLCYDEERFKTDSEYKARNKRFCDMLRDFGYKVIEKAVQVYTNQETGKKCPNLLLIWIWLSI